MSDYPLLDDDLVREFIGLLTYRAATAETVDGFLQAAEVSRLGSEAAGIDDLVDRIIAECGELTDKAVEPIEGRFSGEVFTLLDRLRLLGPEATAL